MKKLTNKQIIKFKNSGGLWLEGLDQAVVAQVKRSVEDKKFGKLWKKFIFDNHSYVFQHVLESVAICVSQKYWDNLKVIDDKTSVYSEQ